MSFIWDKLDSVFTNFRIINVGDRLNEDQCELLCNIVTSSHLDDSLEDYGNRWKVLKVKNKKLIIYKKGLTVTEIMEYLFKDSNYPLSGALQSVKWWKKEFWDCMMEYSQEHTQWRIQNYKNFIFIDLPIWIAKHTRSYVSIEHFEGLQDYRTYASLEEIMEVIPHEESLFLNNKPLPRGVPLSYDKGTLSLTDELYWFLREEESQLMKDLREGLFMEFPVYRVVFESNDRTEHILLFRIKDGKLLPGASIEEFLELDPYDSFTNITNQALWSVSAGGATVEELLTLDPSNLEDKISEDFFGIYDKDWSDDDIVEDYLSIMGKDTLDTISYKITPDDLFYSSEEFRDLTGYR